MEHLRISFHSEGNLKFLCLHCGDTYELNLPCPIEFPEALMKIWRKLHKTCEKRKVSNETYKRA